MFRKNEGKSSRIETSVGDFNSTFLKSRYHKYFSQKNPQGSLAVFCCASIVLTISLIAVFTMSGSPRLQAAVSGWTQSDWSLGADLSAIANYTLNQINWQKFYSKTGNVTVATPNQIKFSQPDSNVTQTSDGNFNGGTADSNTYVADGSVKMKKQNGRPCATDVECASAYCNGSSVCAVNPWVSGICTEISIFNIDISTKQQWKTTNDACVSPQCSGGILVADNNVDFSAYPARDACKALGGRLPSMTEFACLYNNRNNASLGTFQVAADPGNAAYWASREYENDATFAYNFAFTNNTPYVYYKDYRLYVRCVKTQ